MTKTVDLPADIAAKLDERIASGSADTPADVIRAGIAALAEDARKLELIRAKVARALGDQRPSAPATEVFDRVDALIRSLDRP